MSLEKLTNALETNKKIEILSTIEFPVDTGLQISGNQKVSYIYVAPKEPIYDINKLYKLFENIVYIVSCVSLEGPPFADGIRLSKKDDKFLYAGLLQYKELLGEIIEEKRVDYKPKDGEIKNISFDKSIVEDYRLYNVILYPSLITYELTRGRFMDNVIPIDWIKQLDPTTNNWERLKARYNNPLPKIQKAA